MAKLTTLQSSGSCELCNGPMFTDPSDDFPSRAHPDCRMRANAAFNRAANKEAREIRAFERGIGISRTVKRERTRKPVAGTSAAQRYNPPCQLCRENLSHTHRMPSLAPRAQTLAPMSSMYPISADGESFSHFTHR